MKMFVRLHQMNAIVRSRKEHAARTINACAAAGLSRPAGMLRRINVFDVRQKEK
jgi:hypothetical protein